MDTEQGSPQVPPPLENRLPLSRTKNTGYVDYLSSILDERPEYIGFRNWLEISSEYGGNSEVMAPNVYIHDRLSDNTQLPRTSYKAGKDSDVQLLEHTLSNQPAGLRPDELENVEWRDWQKLRTELDRFQSGIRAFTRYLKEDSVQTELQQRLEKIREDEEDLCAEAQALESTIRDTLQVNSGIKSLEESRVSIEEGKRIKLRKPTAIPLLGGPGGGPNVTTLAFIFIPTSLASSIFGMNVQEINSTGKPIWTFILTAILLTSAAVVTWFVTWFMSFLIQELSPRQWQRMPRGTLLGVLTNDRFGYQGAFGRVHRMRGARQQA
ncbi:hypothetical protein Q9189_003169 [Teloschistes chrysophthalmus]